MNNIACVLIFIVVAILILSYCRSSNSSSDSYRRNPNSYFDQGGWRRGNTDAPPPMGISLNPDAPRANLCNECLNDCYNRTGIQPSAFDDPCVNKCKFLC